MKLFEMTDLPTEAGEAKIHFGSPPKTGIFARVRQEKEEIRMPVRNGPDIYLPNMSELEFYPLQNEGRKDQFLAKFIDESYRPDRVFFAGTDERPFMVEIETYLFGVYRDDGEEAFYRALKPGSVRKLEREFNVVAKRQGDIFCVPYPGDFSWKNINNALSFISLGGWKDRLEIEVNGINVFGTRHQLSGYYAENPSIRIIDAFLPNGQETRRPRWRWSIAEGVLTAPDHEDLTLDQPHVLFQAEGLANPKLAD